MDNYCRTGTCEIQKYVHVQYFNINNLAGSQNRLILQRTLNFFLTLKQQMLHTSSSTDTASTCTILYIRMCDLCKYLSVIN